MNPNLLKSKMVENNDTQETLAKVIGISVSNLNSKINGKSASFRQNEIIIIKDRYKLTAKEVDAIFFAD